MWLQIKFTFCLSLTFTASVIQSIHPGMWGQKKYGVELVKEKLQIGAVAFGLRVKRHKSWHLTSDSILG